MRDCVWLLADHTMYQVLQGFFDRTGFHMSLGCGAFEFDPIIDTIVAEGRNDSGVLKWAGEYLQSYCTSHRHAVVMIDNMFEGSPGPESIKSQILEKLVGTGWSEDQIAVIVIDPELEIWMWAHSPHVSRALGWQSQTELREWLEHQGLWPPDSTKPSRPKQAFSKALAEKRKKFSSAHHRKIATEISVKKCGDAAFVSLRNALRSWYPAS